MVANLIGIDICHLVKEHFTLVPRAIGTHKGIFIVLHYSTPVNHERGPQFKAMCLKQQVCSPCISPTNLLG